MNRAIAAVVLLSCLGSARAATLEDAQSSAASILADNERVRAAAESAAKPTGEATALQKHILFFDKNGDGVITPSETTLGLRELGLGRANATMASAAIHLFLGPKTSKRWTTEIRVADIKLGKHGSDTGDYDAEGRYVPEAFERMFSEFDLNHSASLSWPELEAMIAANEKLRPGDSFPASQEFQLLLKVAADAAEEASGKTVPAISRERLSRFYDGSLLGELAKPVS